MYHAVGRDGYGAITTERFRRDIAYIDDRYEIVDLPDVLENPTTGSKRIAITFDDAFENVFHNAVPVLREYNAPATVFAVADYLPDGTVNSDNAYMDWTQLRRLADHDFFTVGNHTKSHPHLARLATKAAIREQIVGAKRALEKRLNTEITRFCYPYGNYTDTVAEVVAETHELATTTSPRLIDESPQQVLIPRIDAKETDVLVRWELTDASRWVQRLAVRLGSINLLG
jgi:peptidoglycan/xylan/chitin deacetylase (PgdA/CDA1 family)